LFPTISHCTVQQWAPGRHDTFVAGDKPGSRSVYLHRALDNHGLSPAAIRDGIDDRPADVVSM
jgi:hypothetical protein